MRDERGERRDKFTERGDESREMSVEETSGVKYFFFF